jgi:hypothetical protein
LFQNLSINCTALTTNGNMFNIRWGHTNKTR